MQAYMKSRCRTTACRRRVFRRVCKQVFADVELPSEADWQRQVLAIWRGAEFREERYAAIELAAGVAPTGFRRLMRCRCTRR